MRGVLQRVSGAHPARRLSQRRVQLTDLRVRLGQTSLHTGLASALSQWDLLARRLNAAASQRVEATRHNLSVVGRRLEAASPKAVLERGYVLVVNEEGQPMTSADQVHAGDQVTMRFADGEHRARIEGESDG